MFCRKVVLFLTFNRTYEEEREKERVRETSSDDSPSKCVRIQGCVWPKSEVKDAHQPAI